MKEIFYRKVTVWTTPDPPLLHGQPNILDISWKIAIEVKILNEIWEEALLAANSTQIINMWPAACFNRTNFIDPVEAIVFRSYNDFAISCLALARLSPLQPGQRGKATRVVYSELKRAWVEKNENPQTLLWQPDNGKTGCQFVGALWKETRRVSNCAYVIKLRRTLIVLLIDFPRRKPVSFLRRFGGQLYSAGQRGREREGALITVTRPPSPNTVAQVFTY